MEWEMVLYYIRVKSIKQGQRVTMQEALMQRQVQALKRVGQGGLNEEGFEGDLHGVGMCGWVGGCTCVCGCMGMWGCEY